MPNIGNGSWGRGNGELQYYKEENVNIDENTRRARKLWITPRER